MPRKILFAEADAAARGGRTEILRQAGFEVIETANGTDALKLASEKEPALVVLRIELPGLDGLAVCQGLKADSRTASIPVLHIAGRGEPCRGYAESLESGADAWLQEPVEPPALVAVATALIRTRSGRDAAERKTADGERQRVRGSVATGVEVTRRKRAEKALRESEKVYRAIGESIDYGVWVCAPDGRNTYASESFLKLVGLTQEQCSNFGWGDVLHPDDAERTIAAWKECVRTEGLWDIEHRYRGVDGNWHPILARGVPVRDEQGRIACWAGINLDISALKRSEEAVRESEAKYRTLFENMAEEVHFWKLVRDEAGRIRTWRLVDANPAALKTWGRNLDEIRGKTTDEIFGPGPTEQYMGMVQKIMAEGVPSSHEDYFPNLDKYFRFTSVPLGDYFITTGADITEGRRAEARLREAQKMESLGLLAGGVAHDFNNLLVGVIGNASLAQEMLPPDSPTVELLEEVIKTGEQAAHLTRQMLAYSGKGKFVVEVLNLSTLIPEMSGLVRPSISRKISLRLDLAEDLPPIEADRGQIQQVFMNLALNAAEAIGSHDGLISVRTGIQNVDDRYLRLHPEATELRPGECVFLEVRDTGCGMDEATKARIFDPFFTTKFTGRGLGLAAVAGIVRSHKGSIAVSSAPGQGSCFTVLFPAAAGAAEEPRATARDAALQGAGVVVVVDDEPVVREMAKKALERYGYTVLLADSGLAALDVLKRHSGDIAMVILDLSMPNMSGEDALPELRRIRPDVKVVVTSGYSETEAMALFKGQAVSGFLQKPYTSRGIAEKVKRCIG